MLQVVGRGLYGTHLAKVLSNYDEVLHSSAEDFQQRDYIDAIVIATSPNKVEDVVARIPMEQKVVDVTPFHRGNVGWQQVTPYTNEVVSDRLSLSGCMASLAMILFGSTGETDLRSAVSLETTIFPSVAGKDSVDNCVMHKLHPQSEELYRFLGYPVDLYPTMHNTFTNGIIHRIKIPPMMSPPEVGSLTFPSRYNVVVSEEGRFVVSAEMIESGDVCMNINEHSVTVVGHNFKSLDSNVLLSLGLL